ncbi:hypothetical protein Tco_0425242 [Tanacetum coccineum]
MANQEQNPEQQEQPFVVAKQVSFNLKDIILNTNNEVDLIYPEHTNQDFFKCVFDFISKCCLREPFTRSLNMYKEYLADFWHSAKALENSKVFFSVPTGGIFGEVGVNTFRNAIGAHYIPYSSEYVAPPFIDIVRPWFETIMYGETIPIKGTLKKSLLPPKWRLLLTQIIQCLGGKTEGFDQITNKDALTLYSLANGINIDYASIFWEDIIIKLNKRHRKKVVPYTRFLSLLMMHKMKEGYRYGKVTPYPTQVFNVDNWALKPNQPEEPLLTNHMLAICNAPKPVVFKAPKPSSNAERVPQGTKPRAKSRHKKHLTSSKQPFVSSKEATKGGSSKAPTSFKTGHSKKRKESSSAMDSNLSRPPISTHVDTGMHKEDQQATGGPTSLGVTSEEKANPQLSNGNDASAVSTAEADPRKFAPSDFVPQQQDQTKFVSEELEIFLTQPIIGKWASFIARQVKVEEASNTIKLEDLAKLVSNVQPSFKDPDSPKDDPVIVVDDSDEDEEDEAYTTTNAKTEDTSVLTSSSPIHKLELKKNKAEAEDAFLKAQPSFPNMGQLNELLVKSLQTEFSKILSAHDFSSSLPTELKNLPSKFNELTKEVKGLKKQVHELEIKLPGDLKEIPTKLEDFTKIVTSLTSQVAELKTLQWEHPAKLLSLLVQVTSVQAKLKTLDALLSL